MLVYLLTLYVLYQPAPIFISYMIWYDRDYTDIADMIGKNGCSDRYIRFRQQKSTADIDTEISDHYYSLLG